MDYSIEELQQMGVYAIVNLYTQQTYVGHTTRFGARWTKHRLMLATGQHPTAELQLDWDIYGAESFEFRILEAMSRIEHVWHAKFREYHYMAKHLDNLYNSKYPLNVLDYLSRGCDTPACPLHSDVI